MAFKQLAFTADQIEALLGQVSGENLLHNWDFRNPVNQRGVSGTVSSAGYFYDRWKLVSGEVVIGSGSITLDGVIAQVLETAAGTGVFASVLMSNRNGNGGI